MSRTTVGILRGGTSHEYPFSLKTGAAMMQALSPEEYDVRDILVGKDGVWHLRGMPVTAARALAQVDVVLNALHGGVGEDGTVQRLLDRAGVPYAGARPHGALLSHNKTLAREHMALAGVPIPVGLSLNVQSGLDATQMAREVFALIGPPYIVKPAMEGASVGVRYAPSIVELSSVIAEALGEHGSILVEEYVPGPEIAVGVIEGFRGEELYVLPPADVVRPDGRFVAHEHYGSLRHVVPSTLSHAEKQDIADAVRQAHRALGMSHFSHASVILSRRGPVVLELDAHPHLFEGSAFSAMLESVGVSLSQFLAHLIGRAHT
jgi:D-alanine-D-alanine ligase